MSTHDNGDKGQNSGFGALIPGFDMMQQLARNAAGSLMQGVAQHAPLPHLPNLNAWVTPTFKVEELEKRIEELKAVHFWLDQNTRALSATIQALEVQKMTLSTLQSMNVSFADVAQSLKTKATDGLNVLTGFATPTASPPSAPAAPAIFQNPFMTAVTATQAVPAPTPAPAPAPIPSGVKTEFAGLEVPPRRHTKPTPPQDSTAPATEAEPESTPPTAAAPAGIDPIQGWNTLAQQFQTLAVNAIKEVSPQTVMEAGKHMASTLTREALKTATDMTANMTRGLVTSASSAAAGVAPRPTASEHSASVSAEDTDEVDAPLPAVKRRRTTKTTPTAQVPEPPSPAASSTTKKRASATKKSTPR